LKQTQYTDISYSYTELNASQARKNVSHSSTDDHNYGSTTVRTCLMK
jgi:hypothetical protein